MPEVSDQSGNPVILWLTRPGYMKSIGTDVQTVQHEYAGHYLSGVNLDQCGGVAGTVFHPPGHSDTYG